MTWTHHHALLAGYVIAMAGWLGARRVWPRLWAAPAAFEFRRPWLDLGLALLACLAVIGVGQLYQHGWRLSNSGRLGVLAETVNQTLIFSPILGLVLLRRQPLSTAWLRTDRVWARLLVGLMLALAALTAFAVARDWLSELPSLLGCVYDPRRLRFAAQVLYEDVAVAIVFVRLAAALRRPILAVLIVGALFAAGHIPALLAGGAGFEECADLVLDFVLVAGVISVVRRSADVWWLWVVHFTMDMTQFFRPG